MRVYPINTFNSGNTTFKARVRYGSSMEDKLTLQDMVDINAAADKLPRTGEFGLSAWDISTYDAPCGVRYYSNQVFNPQKLRAENALTEMVNLVNYKSKQEIADCNLNHS